MDDWDAFDSEPPVASGSASGSVGAKSHILFTDNLDLVRTASDASRLLKRRNKNPLATTSTGSGDLASVSKKVKDKAKAKAKAQAAAEIEAQARSQAAEETKRVEEATVSLWACLHLYYTLILVDYCFLSSRPELMSS